MLGIGEQLGVLDRDELPWVCELLKHSPGFRNWEKWINFAPDAVDFCIDVRMHLRKLLAFVPVHGFQKANATGQLLRALDQRFGCELKELAMDEIFVSETTAEAHWASRYEFGGNAVLKDVTCKRQRRQHLKQRHPRWDKPRNFRVEEDEVGDVGVVGSQKSSDESTGVLTNKRIAF